MKRREFFSWIGISMFAGFLFGSKEERFRKLIAKANKNPQDWVVYPHKLFPEIITPDHPEAIHIEVIDEFGNVMPGVCEVNTRTKLAKQYRKSRNSDGVGYLELDKDHNPIIDKVPYSHLRMKDGRDVYKTLSV